MNRLLAAIVGVALAGSASAFQPRTGTWWNPNESGSAYNLEIQDGTLIATIYSYQPGGSAQWYLASGPLTNNQRNFTGTLDRYVGGQCIACPYPGRPTLVGNDGAIAITFASETSATVTLPGGRTTQIQPFNFGIGDPPSGLFGEWIFVYDIGTSTYAERFNLTSLRAATTNGNGVAADVPRFAFCELQVSGTAAGMVFCGRGDSRGNVLSAYVFRFGLDEAFGGLVLSPPTPAGTFYPMTGFKVKSKGGISRQQGTPIGPTSAAIGRSAHALGIEGIPDAEIEGNLRVSFEALVEAIAGMSRAP